MGEALIEAARTEGAKGEARVYETGYLLVPTLSEEDAKARAEDLKAMLAKHAMSVIAEEAPKRIPLAYTIAKAGGGKREKFTSAYFGWVKFEGDQEELKEIGTTLKKDSSVIRFLLIATVREATYSPHRLLSSDRLEGETIKRKVVSEAGKGKMSEAELDKTIEELVS